jgi:DNA-binding CsgD family transcriptional regulator
LESHADPHWAARVWSVASSSESSVLRALAHYSVALGDDDPEAIGDCRSDFAKRGLRTLEARALVREAIALRRRGSPALALESVERAWVLTSTFGGSQTGFFEPFVDALGLSTREFEIIEMIASGLTTNEVALELSISPRTVENHVFNCFRKTGIGSREDMSRAVATWLTAPGSREH